MLTRLGWAVGISGVLALTAGWLADTPELVAVGLACLAAVLQGFGWMLARADLLAIREIQPTRVSELDPARALLLVQNLSSRRSPSILATDRVGASSLTVPVPSLPAGAAHTTSYPLPTDHRGVFEVGPFSVGHTDPLRLVAASRTYPSAARLTVHPRVHLVAPVPTGVTRDMEGPTSASSPRGGIAFHSIRPYSHGDSIRDVHWKKSAQTGELMVCHKVVPDEPSLMVILDTSAAAYQHDPPLFEDAVRIAASLCVAATSGGYPLELRTTGGGVAVSEGGMHAEPELLDLLAGVTASADDPGLSAAVEFVPLQAAVSLGVVTGRPDPAKLGVLPLIRNSYLMASAVLVDPGAGRSLPGIFTLACRDSDDFARRWNEQVAR